MNYCLQIYTTFSFYALITPGYFLLEEKEGDSNRKL